MIMALKHMMGLALVFVFVGWPQTLLAELEETSVASIELEKEVHFLTPDEVNVVVPPGYYTVEAAENGLQLTRGLLPDEGGEAFLLQATPGTHEEPVDGPIARSIAVEEDAHYLTLLLPEGQSLETIGSYSGVRSREAGWLAKIKQKAKSKFNAVKNRLEEVQEWNKFCSKRSSKVNDINNCCASKYNSCKRMCRKKGKQQVSCQQQCETLNEGCWIRRDANPNWMVNYCGNTKNQRSARTNSREACCQKMETRCQRSCQAFPKSGRAEVCGRCTEAATHCRNNNQVFDFKEGLTFKPNPSPRSKLSHFLEDRWPKKTRQGIRVIKLDEKEGLSLLRNRLLKPASKLVKATADFSENPLRTDSLEGGSLEAASLIIGLVKSSVALPVSLFQTTVAGMLDVFIANEAKKVAHARFVMYTHFAEGVVSFLDPTFKPTPTARYKHFTILGKNFGKLFTDSEKYKVAMALIRQSCHRGLNTNCPFTLQWYKDHWSSSTFLKGMENETLRSEWRIR
jgi:hypothetical protein